MNDHPPARVPWRHPRWTATVLLLAIFAAGALLAGWTVARADRELRADLLQQARAVAQAIQPGQLQALSGTAADVNNPHYRRLKEQLGAVRAANPRCRFVYFMGRRASPPAAGAVFFFVDSEPANSPDYSPPGQLYEEVPAAYRRVFDTTAATVAGPATDRWGVWISALVPLTNPQTGAVVAVLGMDIDARAWKWDVAAQAALPVGLLLLLLIGTATLFADAHPGGRRPPAGARAGDDAPKPILRRVLPPLMAMMLLLLAGGGALLHQQYQQYLNREIAANSHDVAGDLRAALDQQVADLTVTAQLIAADAKVQQALRTGDASGLLAAWRPVFGMLHITHFYFFDRNRTCLLRVHRPGKRGDRIKRFTLIEAERTGKTASGIELGPLGTFTLRVVQPVLAGGARVGYVEVGNEIEDALRTSHIRSDLQLAVVIHKELLNRQAWETSMTLLGREADWDRLPHGAIIYASQGRLPDAFTAWADSAAGKHADSQTSREIAGAGQHWRVSSVPLKDASGQTVGDLLVMRDISGAKAAFARLITLSGTTFTVLLALLLGFVYVLLHHTDADLRAQQAALRESEESYRHQFAHNSAVMLLIDPATGAILDANAAAARFYGYPRERLPAMSITDIDTLPAGDVLQAMAAIMPEQGRRFESQHRLADGSVREVEVSLSRIQFGGRLILHSIVQDVTARKQAEAERERLSVAIEQAAEIIVVTDRQGTIEYVNPTFTAVTGYSRAEAVGHNMRLLKSGQQDAAFYHDLWDIIANGKVWQGRLVNRKKNGTLYTEEATLSPVRDAAGVITNYVAVKRDITTDLSLAAQLVQAQKMESIGRLAGGVAHDFNNILQTILGNAELAVVQMDPADPVRRDLEEIQDAARRATDLTRQLLASARKQAIAPRTLDLNAAVEGVLKMLRRMIGENIELAWAPGAGLWPVKLDPCQIDQILTNLCVNARDAIDGIGTVQIETRNVQVDELNAARHEEFPPGDYVLLTVSDTGGGMDAETRDRIFEPFFTTKATGKGTGLGLATVYGIVRQNRGHIGVYSEPGQGTAFRIHLPRHPVSPPASSPASAS